MFEKKVQDAVFNTVTILILIDGFLQSYKNNLRKRIQGGHNPYFNRWFSAIKMLSWLDDE